MRYPLVVHNQFSVQAASITMWLPEQRKTSLSLFVTRLGNLAGVSKPLGITDRGILACHQRRRKLHDVMRKIWNDQPHFSPAFRKNYCLRHILNDRNDLNVLNDWNDRLPMESHDKERQSLHLSHAIWQLLYTVPGIALPQAITNTKLF
jgi:hypothetical protein